MPVRTRHETTVLLDTGRALLWGSPTLDRLAYIKLANSRDEPAGAEVDIDELYEWVTQLRLEVDGG